MQAIDIDGNYHDASLDEVKWRPSVYAIVIKDNKILLSPQHEKGYDVPGGGVELGENFEGAVIRETKEETGIDVRVIKTLAVRDNLFKVTFREPQEVRHSIKVYYLCQYVGGEVNQDGFDPNEGSYAGLAEWVDLSTIDQVPASGFEWHDIVRAAIT